MVLTISKMDSYTYLCSLALSRSCSLTEVWILQEWGCLQTSLNWNLIVWNLIYFKTRAFPFHTEYCYVLHCRSAPQMPRQDIFISSPSFPFSPPLFFFLKGKEKDKKINSKTVQRFAFLRNSFASKNHPKRSKQSLLSYKLLQKLAILKKKKELLLLSLTPVLICTKLNACCLW